MWQGEQRERSAEVRLNVLMSTRQGRGLELGGATVFTRTTTAATTTAAAATATAATTTTTTTTTTT